MVLRGHGFFKLPSVSKTHHEEWRTNWLAAIEKVRELDDEFHRQIREDTIRTCQRHFHAREIEICKLFPLIKIQLSKALNLV